MKPRRTQEEIMVHRIYSIGYKALIAEVIIIVSILLFVYIPSINEERDPAYWRCYISHRYFLELPTWWWCTPFEVSR